MKITNLGIDEDYDQTCLTIQRPCTCTFLCCNRPFITINYKENNENFYLGKITDPYDFCSYNFKVFDKHNKIRYTVDADCCQCGLFCS